MFTNSELEKKIGSLLVEQEKKEKELYVQSLSAGSMEEALTILMKAEECRTEIENLQKRGSYILRLRGLYDENKKAIGLT